MNNQYSRMAAGGRIGRCIAPRLPAGAHIRPPLPPTSRRPVAAITAAAITAAAAAAVAKVEDEGFLPWLRSKAGAGVSSVLRVGTSPLGRSLFASHPLREGDCIMQVPRSAELRVLLDDDGVAGDTTKVAVLLMMEQHLGHVRLIMESGWAPYVRSLPCKDQMHNLMFWNPNELHMVRNSSVCDEAIRQKEQVRNQFSAVKPALERFPHLFGETKLEDFMHASALVSSRAWQTLRGVSLIPFADFLNHDGDSDSMLIYDEQKDVSEVIADRNYAVGEQVMIRYGKYSNATLALNFGFTLSRNIYDQIPSLEVITSTSTTRLPTLPRKSLTLLMKLVSSLRLTSSLGFPVSSLGHRISWYSCLCYGLLVLLLLAV